MNHCHFMNICTIRRVWLPMGVSGGLRKSLLNQSIPSYALSASGSSLGCIRSNSVSPGLIMELEFQRIQQRSFCVSVKDGNIGDQDRHQRNQWRAAVGSSS